MNWWTFAATAVPVCLLMVGGYLLSYGLVAWLALLDRRGDVGRRITKWDNR